MVCLKLKVEVGAAAGLASAIRIYPEEDLSKLDRMAVLNVDLADHPGDLGLDFIHDLHRLDDADGLPRGDPVADLDIWLGPRLRGLVEGADHRRSDLLEVGRRGWSGGSVRPLLRRRGSRRQRGRHRNDQGSNRCSAGPGDDHPGTEPALHLYRSDL